MPRRGERVRRRGDRGVLVRPRGLPRGTRGRRSTACCAVTRVPCPCCRPAPGTTPASCPRTCPRRCCSSGTRPGCRTPPRSGPTQRTAPPGRRPDRRDAGTDVTALHCATALVDGVPADDVRIGVGPDGRVATVDQGSPRSRGTCVWALCSPARGTRTRTRSTGSSADGPTATAGTSGSGAPRCTGPPGPRPGVLPGARGRGVRGDARGRLDAVGEFHYVHHRPDGTPYDDPNAIGLALASAAREVGIRLTLLDTCYLTGAPDDRSPRSRSGSGTAPLPRGSIAGRHSGRRSVATRS